MVFVKDSTYLGIEPVDDATTYYVRRRGRVEGPWPMAKLRSEVAIQKLGKHDEVSADGSSWRRASDLDGLFVSSAIRKRVGLSTRSVVSVADEQGHEDAPMDLDLEPATFATLAPVVWYCAANDVQLGTFSTAELVTAILDGRVPRDALVWRDGFADWVSAQEVPELMSQNDSGWRNDMASHTTATRYIALAPRRSSSCDYALWTGIGCLLLSWVPLVGFAGLFAIVLGGLGIREIQRSEERAGTGAAVIGIVLGVVSIVVALLELTVIGFVVWQRLFPVSS